MLWVAQLLEDGILPIHLAHPVAIKAGVLGAVSVYAFSSIGKGYGSGSLSYGEAVFASAISGGIVAELQGGKFGHGFISAGAGIAFGGFGNTQFERTIIATVIGGTVSELTGGKFANGAATAAFYQTAAEAMGTSSSDSEDDWWTGYELPDGYYDNKVAWGWGDPLPQGLVDFSAGLGDTLSFGATISVRELAGWNDVVDFGSSEYYGGVASGVTIHVIGFRAGGELSIGKNWRFAPWGNRTGHPYGKFPHYHRRAVDPRTGETIPGGSIKRHRPWEPKLSDKTLKDRL